MRAGSAQLRQLQMSPALPTLLPRSSLQCLVFLSLICLFCCYGWHLVTQASLERALQRLSHLEQSVRQARRREAEALRQANDRLCTELVTQTRTLATSSCETSQ